MPTSEERINEVGRKAQENGNLIWNAANSLFGAFKPHEYGLVILPMCVIKRFHDCLLPKHDAILAANEQYKDFGDLKDGFLKEAAGYQFYNTSKFTFPALICLRRGSTICPTAECMLSFPKPAAVWRGGCPL